MRVPAYVRDEVAVHRPSALSQASALFEIVPEPPPSKAAVRTLIRSLALDRGEQAALRLAVSSPQLIFLTDDSAARLAANALGVRVHGTLGILLRSIRRGQGSREQILDILRSLPEKSTLFVRQDLLDDIIREVEETVEE